VKRWLTVLASFELALASLGVAAQPQTRASQSSHVEYSARALEERLRAPCCRGQLLSAHESDATHALRKELRARLARGESSQSVEDLLVRRYGSSIVAVPRDRDPRGGISLVLVVLLASTSAWLALRARRWVRAARCAAPVRASHGDDALDARLDAELRNFGG
jgi:cytochrome c-type biogenesis protein CcmH